MKHLFFCFAGTILAIGIHGQVSVNTSGNSPDASAGLDVDFSDRGLLPPRMTSEQRDAINDPAPGLTIFNMTTFCTNVFNGTTWRDLCGTCTPVVPAPTEGVHVPSETEMEWHWNAVSGADGYKYNTVNDYSTATDAGASTTYTQTGLSYATEYMLYVWAYNICDGSAVPVELNATTASPPCAVGLIGPGGGRIFYCGEAYPGYLGLEAAPSDQTSGPWGCEGTILPGADGITTGTGYQNTLDVLNGCGTPGIAARICDDLVLGSFDDWFLPSKAELHLMHTNLDLQGLGGFVISGNYWSSSELNNNASWVEQMTSGFQYDTSKNDSYRVRAVRRF